MANSSESYIKFQPTLGPSLEIGGARFDFLNFNPEDVAIGGVMKAVIEEFGSSRGTKEDSILEIFPPEMPEAA